MKCENCGKEHDGSYGSGRFCSDYCSKSYIGKISYQKRVANNTFKSGFLDKRTIASPFGTWKCKCCGFIGKTRAELYAHRKQFHPECAGRKHSAWNKGLTKENSHILTNAAIKASKSLKGKSHPVSKETKEKLSESRSKRLESCRAGFQDVGWYKVKNLNGDEFTVRGHWEENVANKLTKDGILWTKNHCLKYMKDDGIKRTYNPDFYLPTMDAYVEVKGYYSDKDKLKMKLVLEQNDVKIYFIDQYHYQDFINNKVYLKDLLMII